MAGIGEKTDDPVRPVGLDRVDLRGRDQFQHRVPVGAAEPALAAGLLPALPLGRVGDQRLPGRHRIVVLAAGLLPQVQQRPAAVRVLDAQRAVQVPGVRNSALAAARLVRRQRRVQRRIVQPLHLPRHQAVLDVDHPRAPADAVHAVRAAHDLVVLPPVPVELLPAAEARGRFVFDPSDCIACRHAVSLSCS